MKHHVFGVEIDRRRRQRPTDMHHAPGLRAECEPNCQIGVAAIPWWPCRVRRGQAVLNLTTVREHLDGANTNRKAGAFTPAFFGVEFAVDEYDALTGDHLVLPLASSSQIEWSRELITRSGGNAALTNSLNVRSENRGGTSVIFFPET